jgi:hypothetical protein
MSDRVRCVYHYTDGSVANVGDRVRFRHTFGYQGSRGVHTEGVIKSIDHPSLFIDISPETYMEDLGRFGTRLSSVVTIHPRHDRTVVEPDGTKQVHYTISKPEVGWSCDVPVQFNDYIEKV